MMVSIEDNAEADIGSHFSLAISYLGTVSLFSKDTKYKNTNDKILFTSN